MSRRPRDAGTAKIAWLTIALVIIGMVVIGVALLRGQQPTHVGLGPGQLNVDFAAAAGSGLSEEEIAQEQSAMRERIARLEAEAQASGPQAGSASADLTGQWIGANGLTYVIQQTGSNAVIQEWSAGLVTAVGQGSVRGDQAHFQAQAVNGVSTIVDLTLDGPDTLHGTFTNAPFGTTPAMMTRAS